MTKIVSQAKYTCRDILEVGGAPMTKTHYVCLVLMIAVVAVNVYVEKKSPAPNTATAAVAVK